MARRVLASTLRSSHATRLGGSGFPLGFFSSSIFETHRVQLERGDLLFLDTDGLSESRNADGEQYGQGRIEGLAASINGEAPEAVLRACLEDLDAFRGDTPREDDLTVMAIRRIG